MKTRHTFIVLGLDLVLLAAADVGDEPDQARVTFRPRIQRTCSQAARKPRQYRDADLFDDVPDAVEVVVAFLAHIESTYEPRMRFHNVFVGGDAATVPL
jgi:hypothetical protein